MKPIEQRILREARSLFTREKSDPSYYFDEESAARSMLDIIKVVVSDEIRAGYIDRARISVNDRLA